MDDNDYDVSDYFDIAKWASFFGGSAWRKDEETKED